MATEKRTEGRPGAPSIDRAGRTLAQALDAAQRRREQGPWCPAAGGTEQPFVAADGRRLLYVYQASTGRHAYLDVGADLVLADAEAARAMGVAL